MQPSLLVEGAELCNCGELGVECVFSLIGVAEVRLQDGSPGMQH